MRRGKSPVKIRALAPRSGRDGDEPWEPGRSAPDERETTTADDHSGLRGFDLGLVPASVTPPKSSRHAAWFVIATSVLALFSLVTTAHVLFNRPSTTATAGSSPFPRGNFDAPLPRENTAAHQQHRPDAVLRSEAGIPEGRAGAEADDRPSDTDTSAPTQHSRDAATDTSAPGSSPGEALKPDPAVRPTSPPTQAQPSNVPTEDGHRPFSASPSLSQHTELIQRIELIRHTELYFSRLCSGDNRAAFELTSGRLHERGYAAFIEHHPTTPCELTHVEAGASTTLATLRVPQPEQGTRTQRRELSFSASATVRINSDVLVH